MAKYARYDFAITGNETNIVTGYRVTLTEKDQVDKPLNRENTSKGNTTNT
jgi:hypothetical protein